MAIYPPPTNFLSVFNPDEYFSTTASLTQASGDLRYLQLSGGILGGLCTFSAGLQTATIYNTGILTLPISTDTLVGRITTDTLRNKTLISNNVIFADTTDTTKQAKFTLSSSATSTVLTLSSSNTVNRTLTFPDKSDTIAVLSDLTGNYVDLTSAQGISGVKTFNNNMNIGGAIIASTNGSASNPIFSVSGSNNGLFSSGTNALAFSTNGTTRVTITSAIVTSTLQIRSSITGAASPAYSFNIDTGSGFGLISTGNVCIGVGGTQLTNYTATKSSIFVNGSASVPSFGFTSDVSTGFYRQSSGAIGFSSAGTGVLIFNASGISVSGTCTTNTLKIGSGGDVFAQFQKTSVTYGSTISPMAAVVVAVVWAASFSSTPSVQATIGSANAIGSYQNFCTVMLTDITTVGANVQIGNPTVNTVNAGIVVQLLAYN